MEILNRTVWSDAGIEALIKATGLPVKVATVVTEANRRGSGYPSPYWTFSWDNNASAAGGNGRLILRLPGRSRAKELMTPLEVLAGGEIVLSRALTYSIYQGLLDCKGHTHMYGHLSAEADIPAVPQNWPDMRLRAPLKAAPKPTPSEADLVARIESLNHQLKQEERHYVARVALIQGRFDKRALKLRRAITKAGKDLAKAQKGSVGASLG